MSRRRVGWLVVVLLVVLGSALALAATRDRDPGTFHGSRMASQQALQFASCYEVFQEAVAPPEFRCVGGEPTGTFPPCSPDTQQILVRGNANRFVYAGLDGDAAAMFDGSNTVVGNCILDGAYRGRCWGSFRWEIEGTGAWEGTWSGTFDQIANRGFYSAVGHGVEGELQGLHFSGTGAYPGGPNPGTFVAAVSGAE